MKSSLTAMALLGTARNQQLPNAPFPIISRAWQQLLHETEPSVAVLKGAALEHIALHSGVKPIQGVPMATPCPVDPKPYVPASAVSAAQLMLQGELKQLMGEWIARANASGFVAPPRIIPELLDFGQANVHLRPAISALVGSRGHWLAAQTNQWKWLLPASDPGSTKGGDEMWLTGSDPERVSWLAACLEADPDRAANAIEASWRGESPEFRETIAEAVAENPHPAHIGWLEMFALQDRRHRTQSLAVKILMTLPTSGFRKRSIERAATLLKLSGRRLIVTPPTHFDEAWAADGIRRKAPGGKGQRGFWARQILAMVPLSLWPDLVDGHDPFALKLDPDWEDTVRDAWIDSAKMHGGSATLAQLLTYLSAHLSPDRMSKILSDLLNDVPINERGGFLEGLTFTDRDRERLLLNLRPTLSAQEHPVLHHAATAWIADEKSPINRGEAIILAGCCDPISIPAVLDKLSKLEKLTAAAEEFARALEFRHSYLQHFIKHESL
ncbi:MAG: DUF5691 domain-containing protein [Verrucomicrobiales bacterium]